MSDADEGVVELRQYTLHPGRRDELIELFEREFVESQEDCGMRVIGQFRDFDGPDRFVWLRGFADMETRRAALADFYGGPVWKANRDRANATMIDSDNVLLLRPVVGFGQLAERAAPGVVVHPSSTVVITIAYCRERVSAELLEAFDSEVAPRIVASGAKLLAVLETENAENTFTALPVRLGEPCLMWLVSFPLGSDRTIELPDLSRWVERVETLRLEPASRSRLR